MLAIMMNLGMFTPAEIVEQPERFSLGWRPKDKEQAVEVIEEIAEVLQPEIQAKAAIVAIPEAKLLEVRKLAKRIDLSMDELLIIMNLL